MGQRLSWTRSRHTPMPRESSSPSATAGSRSSTSRPSCGSKAVRSLVGSMESRRILRIFLKIFFTRVFRQRRQDSAMAPRPPSSMKRCSCTLLWASAQAALAPLATCSSGAAQSGRQSTVMGLLWSLTQGWPPVLPVLTCPPPSKDSIGIDACCCRLMNNMSDESSAVASGPCRCSRNCSANSSAPCSSSPTMSSKPEISTLSATEDFRAVDISLCGVSAKESFLVKAGCSEPMLVRFRSAGLKDTDFGVEP
mmetsp:Transcript_12844/g.45489  ORF Transcript_12844/g.45489 Transcript_12844/m.45489 type:complete len:252 (+) Transcript_12844:5603-6358(+)